MIFNQEKFHTFYIELPKANLARIDANPAAEEYVVGRLIFEGDTISPVGIRYKGSIGAFVGCLSGTDFTNPSGYKTCTKLSMKVKLNWADRKEHFYGLNKLQFHSQNLDNSKMRERLGYWFFREMGVPAPRSVHAKVMINGIYSGVYALTEQIDGRFAKDRFENGKGNVYKEIWPINSSGQVYNDQRYLNALKTNEDESPDISKIRDFGQKIANASQEELQDLVIEGMDLNQIMAYSAVDRTIRHDDGPFHWYCSSGGCSNHNYYWYEAPVSEKLHLIAWDMDNAFENIVSDFHPVTPIADKWGETQNNCEPFSYGLFRGSQRSASCDKLTAAWASFDTEYQQKVIEFIQGPLSKERVDEKLETWSAQIQEAVQTSSDLHKDVPTPAIWNDAIRQLKDQTEYAAK